MINTIFDLISKSLSYIWIFINYGGGMTDFQYKKELELLAQPIKELGAQKLKADPRWAPSFFGRKVAKNLYQGLEEKTR